MSFHNVQGTNRVTTLQGKAREIRPGVSQESKERAQSMNPGSLIADTRQLKKGKKKDVIVRRKRVQKSGSSQPRKSSVPSLSRDHALGLQMRAAKAVRALCHL